MPHYKHVIFFLAVVMVFLAFGHSVLALETTYPAIPGVGSINSNSTLGDYLLYFFSLAIIALGIIGVIYVVVAGVRLLSGSQNAAEAKERIRGIIFGIILLILSFILLKTINPQLVNQRVTPLNAQPGVYFMEPSSMNNTAPFELSLVQSVQAAGTTILPTTTSVTDTSFLPQNTKLFYKCTPPGPNLMVWTYDKTNLEITDASNLVFIPCVDTSQGNNLDKATLSLEGIKSFKRAYEEPGVYAYLKPNCQGTATEDITISGTLPEFVQNKVSSLRIINGNGEGDPRYGAVLARDPDLKGSCTPPLMNFDAANINDPGNIGVCVNTPNPSACNIKKPAYLKVDKVVHGGDKSPDDFALFVGGQSVQRGVENTFDAGTYTISETQDPDYTATFSGVCDENGQATLKEDTQNVCTITNTFNTAKLTVVKKVVGGTKKISDFPLNIEDVEGTSTKITSGTTETLGVGDYTVSETNNQSYHYTESFEATNEDGTPNACDDQGNVTLSNNENVTCTITNTYNPNATLTINKLCGTTPWTVKGFFDLRIDETLAGTGGGVSCPAGKISTTGAVQETPGKYTVSEVPIKGTSTSMYTSVIGGDCAKDGTITLKSGQHAVCTITNNYITPPTTTLTVNKLCGSVPWTPSGHFQLKIDGQTSGSDAVCAIGISGTAGTTGAVNVTPDVTHTVSETSINGTTASMYTSAIGGDCASNGSITLQAGDHKVCTITNTKRSTTATLTIIKACAGTWPARGTFNLQINGANVGQYGASCSFGGALGNTGPITKNPGTYTVGEVPTNGTDNASYASSFPPTNSDGSPNPCFSQGRVTLAAGDSKTCTILNTFIPPAPTLKIIKKLFPASDPGRFNLQIQNAAGTAVLNQALNKGNNGSLGPITKRADTYKIVETAAGNTNLAAYAPSITCSNNGVNGAIVNASSTLVTLVNGDNYICTISNAKQSLSLPGKPTITVKKQCSPTTDVGRFQLMIDGTRHGSQNTACGEDTGSVTVSAGTHSVSEAAGSGTKLSDYSSSISCDDKNHTFGNGTSLNGVTVANGDNVTCTITNTNNNSQTSLPKPTITVKKQCNPSTDTGRFTLMIDGTRHGSQNTACGEDTGSVTVSAGTHSVSEAAGSGTKLSNYSSSISCDDRNSTSGNKTSLNGITVSNGDNVTCTITNTNNNSQTSLPTTATLTIFKACAGNWPVRGQFNLQINGANADQYGASCSFGGALGNTGPITENPGTYRVGETPTNGTSTSIYTAAISCSNGAKGNTSSLSVRLNANDNVTCTITNTYTPSRSTQTCDYSGRCLPGQNGGVVCGSDSDCSSDYPYFLVVVKDVKNHGGNKQVLDFPLEVDGSTVLSGIPNSYTDNVHVITEKGDPNYSATYSDNCLGGVITLLPNMLNTCTITNEENPSYLTVKKVVPPPGTKSPDDFGLFVNAQRVQRDEENKFPSGSYLVHETNNGGYTKYFDPKNQDGTDNACDSHGNVTLVPGEHKVCTITNRVNPIALQVLVRVIQNGAGRKQPKDFQLSLTGGPNGTQLSLRSGDTASLYPGPYQLTVTNPDPNYRQSYERQNQDGSNNKADAQGNIIITSTDPTATVTETYIGPGLPQLTVTKLVYPAGSKAVSFFNPFQVHGPCGPQTVYSGQKATLNCAGTFTITEHQDPAYDLTFDDSTCPGGQINLGLGDVQTCTLFNTQKAPNGVCSQNSDCGSDTPVGNPTCQNGNVKQAYWHYTCNNPNQYNSSCSKSQIYKLQSCPSGQICRGGACVQQTIRCYDDSECPADMPGSFFCQNNNVWQHSTTFHCINAGKPSSACVSKQTSSEIQQCQPGAEKCIGATCMPNVNINPPPPLNPPVNPTNPNPTNPNQNLFYNSTKHSLTAALIGNNPISLALATFKNTHGMLLADALRTNNDTSNTGNDCGPFPATSIYIIRGTNPGNPGFQFPGSGESIYAGTRYVDISPINIGQQLTLDGNNRKYPYTNPDDLLIHEGKIDPKLPGNDICMDASHSYPCTQTISPRGNYLNIIYTKNEQHNFNSNKTCGFFPGKVDNLSAEDILSDNRFIYRMDIIPTLP
jgi:hypothetical protein